MSIEFLRRLPIFAGLSEADLENLYRQARPITVPAKQMFIEQGAPGDALYVLLDGELEITKRAGEQDVKLDVRKAGEVIGEMSLLDHAPRSASVRALTDSQLLMIPQAAFDHVLSTSPSAAMAILHTVIMRLRQNEAMLHAREKMAGLGTLAAGLAHELNNPAAAVRRAAAQLRELLPTWQRAMSDLDALKLDAHQIEHVQALREAMVQRASQIPDLDPLARSDREGELQTWLEVHRIDQAWELAPTLVTFGWQVGEFENLAQQFSAEQLTVLARALGLGCSVYALLEEVGMSAERMSELVQSVKTYSYLDRAPVQEVNVHEGLDNTLVILRHKLKSGVNVKREYAADLPRIEAYASELNQVWTNIVDNAIDAMQGQGDLTVRTFAEDEEVAVEICDSGPGIPPEIQSRVFEPFFTTKPPGVGTGLGLNIAYNIVNKHYGQIKISSRPGATCFQVRLPLHLPRGK